MNWIIMLPLIVVACVFAAIPVFYDADDREHRLIHYGSASKPKLQTEHPEGPIGREREGWRVSG